MAELLYILLYLGVLAVVIGCGAYLFFTRKRGKPDQRLRTPEISREVLKRAEKLGGRYRLSDLESILTKLALLGAWGVVLELQLKSVNDIVQAVVDRDGVELASNNLGVLIDHLGRFRRAAVKAGLEVHPFAGQEDVCYVEITGSWGEIAATILQFVSEIYNLGGSTEVDVNIFR